MSFLNKNIKIEFTDNYESLKFFGVDNKNILFGNQPPLFSACFRDTDGNPIYYNAQKKHKCSIIEDREGLSIKYFDFEDDNLSVVISLYYDEAKSQVIWKADVECKNQLEWLEFPGIAVKNNFKENGGNSKLLWPYNEGVLVDSISDRYTYFPTTSPNYPSLGNYAMCPGMIFAPFMALISEEVNLYFGAHDKRQNSFCVDFDSNGDSVNLKIRVYPGVNGGCYDTTYDTVIQFFSGDWFDAADIYRNWFEQNVDRKTYKRIKDNKSLPQWYNDSPIVITYCVRGHYDTDKMESNKLFPYVNALPLIDKLSEKLKSRILVVLMHWEGSAPWAPPYVMPPYGGEESLKEYIYELHKRGHILGVYCSGLGWTEKSNIYDYNKEETFKEKELFYKMCLSPKQELPYSKICTAQRVGYDICPSTDFAHKTLTDEVKKMDALGIDYIQLMDQNHGGTPYFCYSNSHNHPPVPGTWESKELKSIIKEIKDNINNEKLLLGCESAASEVFIPEFLLSDNRFELNYLFGLPVPLYSYIYHEYLHNFMGNQVCGEDVMANNKSRFNLLYRMAYSFTAGDLITLVINDEGKIQWAWGQSNFDEEYMPDTEETISFASMLNSWRRGVAEKYLNYGKMIHPIIKPDLKNIVLETGVGPKKISPIMYQCFESEDGSVGQIMVNYTNSSVEFSVDFSNETLIYTSPNKKGKKIDSNTIRIDPLSAIMLETKN